MTIIALLKSFRTDEGGATAIEYGLIVGIISAALVAVINTGIGLNELYDVIALIALALS